MNLETFFEKFELFADAPNAVAKMRELILHMAVRGKLVPQDPSDESGRDLIARIDREMKDEVRLRHASPLSELPVECVQFELPEQWVWAQFRDVAVIASNLVNPSDYLDFVHLAPDNIEKGNGVLLRCATVREDKVISSNHRFRAGQIIYSKIRPNLAKAVVVNFDGLCSADMYPIDALIDANYLHRYMLSESFLIQAIKTDTRVAMPKINQAELNAIVVPVPPLAEQKRIVAKVDELMALCDRLEVQQRARETQQVTLARAAVARFADAPTPANIELLFHKSYSVAPTDLRKTILTLAVQGKLVPQDSNDEPAVHLIQRITEKRQSLKAKEYCSIELDEMPYDLPDSWSWVRLGSISFTSDSGWSPQCDPEPRSGNNWGVLKVSAVSWGTFRPDENKALPSGMSGRTECEVRAGDFLLSRANTEELVARSVVVEKTPPRLMMSDKIVRFTFSDEIEKVFVNLANSSSFARDYYAKNASGTSSSMKNVGREVMCNLPVPFPPLAEQRRIVAKVDQLMALVDQLEAQLTASRAAATALMDALVAELTAAHREQSPGLHPGYSRSRSLDGAQRNPGKPARITSGLQRRNS